MGEDSNHGRRADLDFSLGLDAGGWLSGRRLLKAGGSVPAAPTRNYPLSAGLQKQASSLPGRLGGLC